MITEEQKELIFRLRAEKKKAREIAEVIHRDVSTVFHHLSRPGIPTRKLKEKEVKKERPCARCGKPFMPLRESNIYCGGSKNKGSCSRLSKYENKPSVKKPGIDKKFLDTYGRPPNDRERVEFERWTAREKKLWGGIKK